MDADSVIAWLLSLDPWQREKFFEALRKHFCLRCGYETHGHRCCCEMDE